MIVVDVKKEKGERISDLSRMAYYMEKDVCTTCVFVCVHVLYNGPTG